MTNRRDVLLMLIKSACSDGCIADSDRELLEKKAASMGISSDELNKMIDEALGIKTSESQSEVITVEIKKDKKPYLIIVAAVIVTALICFFVFYQPKNVDDVNITTSDTTDTVGGVTKPIEQPVVQVDERLQQRLLTGDEIFSTKNIAKAKAYFKTILIEYPENQWIMNRIAKCDEILKNSDYQSLKQKRENDKLGFEDNDGYIVIDFLYDEEVERKSEIMILKNGEKIGAVGGCVKDFTETKYIESVWVQSENSYRLVKNQSGDCDFVTIKNGNLIISEY